MHNTLELAARYLRAEVEVQNAQEACARKVKAAQAEVAAAEAAAVRAYDTWTDAIGEAA